MTKFDYLPKAFSRTCSLTRITRSALKLEK